jgi:hypothetical protein
MSGVGFGFTQERILSTAISQLQSHSDFDRQGSAGSGIRSRTAQHPVPVYCVPFNMGTNVRIATLNGQEMNLPRFRAENSGGKSIA